MLNTLFHRLTGSGRSESILNLLSRPDRATDRLRDSIAAAVQIADELDSPAVESRHVLMAALRCDTMATRVLTDCDLPTDKLVSAIHDSLAAMRCSVVLPTDIPAVMKATDDWALRANRRLFDCLALQYIGTEHLLLGLATDGTWSSTVLKDCGIHLATLSEKVDQMFTPLRKPDEP